MVISKFKKIFLFEIFKINCLIMKQQNWILMINKVPILIMVFYYVKKCNKNVNLNQFYAKIQYRLMI